MRAKQFLKLAKGFRGRAKNCTRIAANRVGKSLEHQYVGRKLKKREVRSLWIQQINAGAREYNIGYSAFIHGVQGANIVVDRKILADLAQTEPHSFRSVVEVAKDCGIIRELKPSAKVPIHKTE